MKTVATGSQMLAYVRGCQFGESELQELAMFDHSTAKYPVVELSKGEVGVDQGILSVESIF